MRPSKYEGTWRERRNAASRTYSQKASSKRKRKDYLLRTRYGMSLADYFRQCIMQLGQCAICTSNRSKLFVDHDHKTNTVRGLICHFCNTKLGWLESNRSSIDSYLEVY